MNKIAVQDRLDSIIQPLLEWYAKEARELPWRKTVNPYHIWVSEIMLQQTRVDTVIPYYNRFMKELPTIKALANATEDQLLKLWEGLGYYSRVRNMWKAAKMICEEYGETFPTDYNEILRLPGIGTYTAGAISSIAYGQPKPAVDGNVLRVITRVLANSTDISDTAFKKWVNDELEKVYPVQSSSQFTQSLMELGALICIPNGAPKCEQCPLASSCMAKATGRQGEFPVKKKKKERKKIKKTVFLLYSNHKFAIRKRIQSGLLSGMWEFPNEDSVMSQLQVGQWLHEHGIMYESIIREPDTKHIFTHIEWDMSNYLVFCRNQTDEYKWITAEELNRNIALPTAFKKIYDKMHLKNTLDGGN